MIFRFSCVILSLSILSGCATSRGFNRTELREKMSAKDPTVTDEDIKKTLALKPQLPKPFKLGVIFQAPEMRGNQGAARWMWSEDDRKKILAALDSLKTSHEVSDVFVVSDATISETDLKSLRLAAARHGADAVLVVAGISDIDSYNTKWGWTYLALVTTLFVPASTNDALFLARATLWDVRNEFLYLAAEGESMKKETHPAAFTDERRQVEESKADAINALSLELSKRIGSIAGPKSKRE